MKLIDIFDAPNNKFHLRNSKNRFVELHLMCKVKENTKIKERNASYKQNLTDAEDEEFQCNFL